MIIVNTPSAPNYNKTGGMACKIKGKTIIVPQSPETNDICLCDVIDCEYTENIFACPSGDYWKNDKSDFLYRRLVSSDTINIELHKNGVKIENLNDNSFGEFFNGFPNGSSEQQLYVGYLIDWELVYAAYGGGKYKVVSRLNILGNESITESREFNLIKYSDLAANKTVRIETYQNGNIFGNDFDFTGLNWYQSLRIPATFGNPTPEYENSRYITETHEVRQIKDTMSRVWDLNTGKIPYEVASKLVYNKMLANTIFVTDYKVKSESIWRRVGVVLDSIDKPELFESVNKIYNIKMKDSKEIFTKRNF